MDKRIVEFIRGLRATGVRISLAESEDALKAIDTIGLESRPLFRDALAGTLIKEHNDHETFEHFFDLFFSDQNPPMWDMNQELTSEEAQQLQDALQTLMENDQALQDLIQRLMEGRPFSQEELEQMAQNAGMSHASNMYQQGWFANRMFREAALNRLRDLMEELFNDLRQAGMSEAEIEQIKQMMAQNAEALAEQIRQFAGAAIAKNMAQQPPEKKEDVSDLPFQYLSPQEAEQVRDEIRRLAARLRSRASLRQKKASKGQLDPRKTLRHNLRFEGTPLELRHKKRHVKPRVVAICDLSGSMRYMSEFALTLTYMLQDVVAKTRSFVFIADIVEVTEHFQNHPPEEAVEIVLRENPRGYYTTDLGNSLVTFEKKFSDSLDRKTTVLFVGDGRNNYNHPRLEIVDRIRRRARRVLWFCPEPEYQWGTGDSDMQRYAPISDDVFLVRNLRELGQAVDKILSDG